MKTLLVLLLILAGCSSREQPIYRTTPSETRRYELVTGPQTFLLDNRAGRVWLWDSADFMEVTPGTLSPGKHTTAPATNAFADLIP